MENVKVAVKLKNEPLKIKVTPVIATAEIEEKPLDIVKNGIYHTPFGVKYNPITVDVTMPTLNAPTIEFNANGGYVYILDSKNGNFSKGYELYLNGEKSTTFTATSVKMQDYGISETDEIGIIATGDLFNNSPMATARWSDLELGTIGLTYNENKSTGIGTATADEIYIASIVNNFVITVAGNGEGNQGATSWGALSNKTIYFPNSITQVWAWGNATTFSSCMGCTFVFGTDIGTIHNYAFFRSSDCIYDFRKATKIPTVGSGGSIINNTNPTVIVPDSLYDEWIVATNWATIANKIVKDSIWEAQQGGSV